MSADTMCGSDDLLSAFFAGQVPAVCVRPDGRIYIPDADKPTLPPEEVRKRLAQFAWRAPLWLTRAPTFREKALLFPGAVFVVGADTAARVVEHRFYENQEACLHEALTCIRGQGCRFLVAGRVDAAGCFWSLPDIALPEPARDLFDALPPEKFRLDISSTQFRRISG
jgi:hypothetical protein